MPPRGAHAPAAHAEQTQPQAKRRREETRARAPAPAPRRHGETALGRRSGLDVKMEVFALADMPLPERRLLRKRFQSELEAVRDLLKKAEFLAVGAVKRGPALPSSTRPAPPSGKKRRFLAAKPQPEAPMESNNTAAKRRKMSPLVEQIDPKMTLDEKDQLAGFLASLSAELPAHIVEFLQPHCSRDRGSGEIEIDIHSLEDATLFELKKKLDKLTEERKQGLQARSEPSKNHGAMDASGVSRPSPHQRKDSKLVEEEEDEYVDICGGVSPMVTAVAAETRSSGVHCVSPLLRQFGELLDVTRVQLLSPLRREYLELAKEDEYIDICGDASPVVIEKVAEHRGSPSSSSSSDSGSSCSDSDSDSGSESESEPESDESVNSPAGVPKGNEISAQPLQYASEVQSSAEEKLQKEPVPTRQLPDLIARAQAAMERRRREEKARADEHKRKCLDLEREKARQALLQVERTALASDRIHPVDLKMFGIVTIEHGTSPELSRDGTLHFAPGSRSVLQKLGLFMKADDCRDEEEQKLSCITVIEDIEEGEIG